MIEAEILSNKICELCSNDLDVFSQFRRDWTVKQNLLNKAFEQQPELTFISSVKSELTEFVDSAGENEMYSFENTSDAEDETFLPQASIKHEAIEVLTDDYEANYWHTDSLNDDKKNSVIKQLKKPKNSSKKKNKPKERVMCPHCGLTFSTKSSWGHHVSTWWWKSMLKLKN